MGSYTVFILPGAIREIQDLTGNIKQRVKREIKALAGNPRPTNSKSLAVTDFEYEVRRIRLERWRIVYTIVEDQKAIDVLAIRKRPPYDYGDLALLLEEIEQR